MVLCLTSPMGAVSSRCSMDVDLRVVEAVFGGVVAALLRCRDSRVLLALVVA